MNRAPVLSIPLSIIALAAMLMLGACGDDGPSAPTTDITDADAAALIAMALGRPGGFQMNLSHAVEVSRGGLITSRQGRKGASPLRDTSITHAGTETVDGKTYSHSMAVNYLYSYTSNGFNNPREYFFAGNTELKFSANMKGTITKPAVAAVDSAWCVLFFNGTDAEMYTLSGKFGRVGSYTFPGTDKIYSGKVESANMPGVLVDRNSKEVNDSQLGIEMNLRGTDKEGDRVDWSGVLIMRPGQPTRLNIAGKTYVIDLNRGTATLQ